MDINENKNKSVEFARKNKNNIVVALVIIVLVILYFASQGRTEKGQQTSTDEQRTEQTGDSVKIDTNDETDSTEKEQGSANSETKLANLPTGGAKPLAIADTAKQISGDVSAKGILRVTNNPTKGNLMLDTGKGNIYIATQRDFSALIGKEVTLQADGTMEKFAFLGFKEAGSVMGATTPAPSATNSTAMGGDGDKSGTVTFSGNMGASDNAAKGNYVITSGSTKVYIQSQKDYSGWLGKDVTLTASGSLESFTGAMLMQK